MRHAWLLLAVMVSGAAAADEVSGGLRPPGFELGVRTGYALPFGKMDAKSTDVSDTISGQIPIWLDVGYRVTPSLVLAAYGQLGIGLFKDDCPSGASCSAKDWRFGVAARYHIQPAEKVDPWLSAGVGYEVFSISASAGGSSIDLSAKGWELANLQAGIDFQVSRDAYVGPFVSFSLDEITSESGSIGNLSASTSDFDKSLHEWLLIGVRGRFEL